MEFVLRIDPAELSKVSASVVAALAAAGVRLDYQPPAETVAAGDTRTDHAGTDSTDDLDDDYDNVLNADTAASEPVPNDAEDEPDTLDELRPSWRRVDRAALPALVFARAHDCRVECRYSRTRSNVTSLGRLSYRLLRSLWESDEWSRNVNDLWLEVYGDDYAGKIKPPTWQQHDKIKKVAEKLSTQLKQSGIPYRVGGEGYACVLSRVESG